MTARERGFLLLSSKLGNPDRKCLTQAQLRTLAACVRTAPRLGDGTVSCGALMEMGVSRELAQRTAELLDQEEMLSHYLRRAAGAGCVPITRGTRRYPPVVRERLGEDSPGCIWAKGPCELLDTPMVALVGSRDIRPENRQFAQEAGRQCAEQGFTLVSGNARGADQAAQAACIQAGGQVICVVADSLEAYAPDARILYLSEDSFDLPFSCARALSRNRIIHALGTRTLVAQCAMEQGGTWDGTARNLRFGWSPVYCFADGSAAAEELVQMGAEPIAMAALEDLAGLPAPNPRLF